MQGNILIKLYIYDFPIRLVRHVAELNVYQFVIMMDQNISVLRAEFDPDVSWLGQIRHDYYVKLAHTHDSIDHKCHYEYLLSTNLPEMSCMQVYHACNKDFRDIVYREVVSPAYQER